LCRRILLLPENFRLGRDTKSGRFPTLTGRFATLAVGFTLLGVNDVHFWS
jgi:hypothetical protein